MSKQTRVKVGGYTLTVAATKPIRYSMDFYNKDFYLDFRTKFDKFPGKTYIDVKNNTAVWHMLYNHPRAVVIIFDDLSKRIEGIMKYCSTHGTKVYLHDHKANHQEVIHPVGDFDKEVLLTSTFSIENIDESKLEYSKRKFVWNARVALNDARKNLKAHIWRNYNRVMLDYKASLVKLNLERRIDNAKFAVQSEVQYVLNVCWELGVDAVEFLRKVDRVKEYVAEYQAAYDIHVDVVQAVSDCNDYIRKYNPDYKGYNGGVYKDILDTSTYDAQLAKELFYLKRDLYVKLPAYSALIDAYTQLRYYESIKDPEFLHPDYMYCPDCKHPINVNAEICERCDWEPWIKPEEYPVSPDSLKGNERGHWIQVAPTVACVEAPEFTGSYEPTILKPEVPVEKTPLEVLNELLPKLQYEGVHANVVKFRFKI